MTEKYHFIIKNDVWEVVPKPKNKDVVSSKWIYKIKTQQTKVLKNIKQDLWLVVFLKSKVLIMKRHFLL
jgi:hypothetical protein